MIVDGKEENAIFFKVLLMNRQYQNITMCKSGEEALELIETKRIQFIITAWELPGMTGTAFVQRVKAKRQFAHIPFVLYSARLSPDEIKLTSELGLRNIIRMPVTEDGAFAVIGHVVAIEESLDPIEIVLRTADKLFLEKQYSQSLNELKPALVKGAFFHRAQTLLGEIYYGEQQLPEAENAVKDALDHDDTYHEALHLIAKIFANTGRHAQAIDMLKKMNLESPLNIQTLIDLGSAQMDSDMDAAAKATFDKADKIDPEHPKLKDEKGKLAFKQGDYGLARQLLAETASAEDIVRHLNNVAVGIVSKKDFAQGIKVYEAAIGILKEPGHSHVLEYNMGLALRKKGELRKAFDVLASVYERAPEFAKAYAAFVHVVKEMENKQISYNRQLAEKLKALHQQTSRAS